MIDSMWNFVARSIATRPCLIYCIQQYASKRPYSHLFHSDGSPYMSRWWLMPKWMLGRDEFGEYFPHDWMPIKIRLHHIHTADYERDLHDHPADYRTLLIKGWYDEEDIFGDRQEFYAGESRKARAETFHRIKFVGLGGTWTIFIMWKKRLRWGFLVDGHKIYWKDYFKQKDSKTIP